MNTDLKDSTRGSFTVEAAVIFPAIFLCIAAVMYACILLYQHAMIQSLADRAAERGAATWGNAAKSIALGSVNKEDIDAGGLYWRLYDFKKEEKKQRVEGYITDRMDKYTVFKADSKRTSIEMLDYIVYKKLVVTIECRYRLPIGKFLRSFGLGEHYTVSARSEAVINEPAEFIRNTDLVIDLEKELEQKYPEMKRFGDKMRGTIEKVHNTLLKFLGGDK